MHLASCQTVGHSLCEHALLQTRPFHSACPHRSLFSCSRHSSWELFYCSQFHPEATDIHSLKPPPHTYFSSWQVIQWKHKVQSHPLHIPCSFWTTVPLRTEQLGMLEEHWAHLYPLTRWNQTQDKLGICRCRQSLHKPRSEKPQTIP